MDLAQNAPPSRMGSLPREPRILFVHSRRRLLHDVKRALRSFSSSVELTPSLGQLPPDAFDLFLVDYDGLSATERAGFERWVNGLGPTRRLLVVSGGDAVADLPRLIGGHSVTNVLGRAENDTDDLVVTVRKLLEGDIFGVGKYFAWGTEVRTMKIRRSAEKGDAISWAERYARSLGVPGRLVTLFSGVVDELVSNAIFNAPVDAAGKRRFRHLQRTRPVELAPHEEVQLQVASDGCRLGVSTTDPFGSLGRLQLLDLMARGLRREEPPLDEGQGGAGIGLYLVYESLSHFVVNLAPGRCTEMIGLLDVRGSFRDFARRPKSFNVFVAGAKP